MKRIAKTPAFNSLRKIFRLALAAETLQTDALEVTQRQAEFNRSRRKFLENTGKTMLAGALAPQMLLHGRNGGMLNRLAAPAAKPNIAIVGAGIAGLTALHHLKKYGLDATVYESSGRTGGRMFTVQQAMGAGTWTEFGGEFIDTDHQDMWDLIREFNLETIDYMQASEATLHKEAFFFNGRHYSLAQAVEAFRPVAKRLKADMDKLPDDISYTAQNPYLIKLDKTSISTYLTNIGATGWVKKFIEVAYESEYGLSPRVQSSLNLLLLISPETNGGEIALFGTSDERYKVKGGNQSIPDALAKKYNAHIETNRSLESIRENGNGYALYFSGTAAEVLVDYVILTIPFKILRNLSLEIKMTPKKRACIDQLGFGTNAKLMIGMENHYWRKQGYTGLVYSDNGIPNGWDNAQLQTPDEAPAGLSILFGGPSGVNVGKGSPEFQKNKYLQSWEQIYPGAKAHYSGKVARMHWPSYPHSMGSYICPKVGQYTSIIGLEQQPVGNVLFAGEHCGGDYAGFMNGGALSGRQAAEEIAVKVGAKK